MTAAEAAAGFRRLAGQGWEGDAPVPVAAPRQDWGGMSNGMVDPRWWRRTGLPLLMARRQTATAG